MIFLHYKMNLKEKQEEIKKKRKYEKKDKDKNGKKLINWDEKWKKRNEKWRSKLSKQ